MEIVLSAAVSQLFHILGFCKKVTTCSVQVLVDGKKCLSGSSIHSLLQTMWSARIDAVKALAKNLNSIKRNNVYMLVELLSDVKEILHYLQKFVCVLMWLKVLTMINETNVI